MTGLLAWGAVAFVVASFTGALIRRAERRP